MFDFSWSEIALIVIVALVFIGPKEMPTAIRAVSRGLKAVRRIASEFQGHVDEMVRDADLGEARDHLRDLKRFDFRDRIARTIDSDQTISKSLDFAPPPSLSAPSASGVVESFTPISGAETIVTVGEESEVAPSILPPLAARRISHEQPHWFAPAIIPPLRVIHNGKRIALDPLPKPSISPIERGQEPEHPTAP